MTDIKSRMRNILSRADDPGQVVPFPPRVDFNELYDDIRAAEAAVRTADHEVSRAELNLDEMKTVLLARENELTDLRQKWWDESARIGVKLTEGDSQ